MSSAAIKKDVSAYQRWEMASFGETRPSHITVAKIEVPEAVVAPSITAQEIEQIKAHAQSEGYSTGYQEAYEKGLHEGQAAGMKLAEDSMREHIQAMKQLAENFIREIDQAGKNTGQELLELAISLAENILKTKLELDREAILPIVEEAIAQVPTIQQPANILLHPQDALTIKQIMGEALHSDGWKIVSDNQLERGDCKIETAYNMVDATIETRWSTLKELIQPKLKSAM